METREGKVRRFDLLFKGSGERISDEGGFAACMTAIPKGRTVPVALLLTLADPSDDLSRVLPLHVLDEGYLR